MDLCSRAVLKKPAMVVSAFLRIGGSLCGQGA